MSEAVEPDLFGHDAVLDPYTYFGRLREVDPIHWDQRYELWLVTRYEDLVWVTGHPELFSNEVFKRDPRPPYPPIPDADVDLYEGIRAFFSQWLVQKDAPRHTEMRRAIHGFFNPRTLERWRGTIRDVIGTLLDEAQERGSLDVKNDFAAPLPLLVFAQMMGLPAGDREFIQYELAPKLLFMSRGESDRMQTLANGIEQLKEYLKGHLQERASAPGDDLLSALAQGERDGAFTRDEAVANAILLLVAGHDTTSNLITNGTLAFLRHEDQWAAFKKDPDALAKRATEECLRYDSPQKTVQRIATQDVEMRSGKTIRESDRVRWVISSANRDPEKFENPDRFDISRDPNPHVTFGSGVHHCLGASLTRLEAPEAFKALAQRFPSLHLADGNITYQPSISFRSVDSLPVAWNG